VLQVVLVLAISISAIVFLAARHESGVSVGERKTTTGVSNIDPRWTPKWAAAEGFASASQPSVLDTRWIAKMARAEAAAPNRP
jgi:hypothetical protein